MQNLLNLERDWVLGEHIDGGGFGQVYSATSADGVNAVAKIVPKAPGAQRELLFVNLSGARNVMPIIDSGEAGDSWVLVMPRAEVSLLKYLDDAGGSLDVPDAIKILADVTRSLVDLDGKVVHRDIKPGNVLLWNGNWCLADFGISRYAEATTAPDTQKYALSPPYAAPERWRSERATTATDVYSLGVVGFQILTDSLPFTGPDVSDFRDQHLHAEPPVLTNVTPELSALITECLYKPPEARPSPANILARIERIGTNPNSSGLAKLRDANLAEARRKGEHARQESEYRSAAERRDALYETAAPILNQAWSTLIEFAAEAAPSATIEENQGKTAIRLNCGQLHLNSGMPTSEVPWGSWKSPAFDVIAHASISLTLPPDRTGYEGRSHSLWFCDAQEASRYQWFETAFMISPLIARSSRQDPYAMDPNEQSAKALWVGMAEYQVAWPFTPLIEHLTEFIDRWLGWLADAADGRLHHPYTMPERPPQGSWRHR